MLEKYLVKYKNLDKSSRERQKTERIALISYFREKLSDSWESWQKEKGKKIRPLHCDYINMKVAYINLEGLYYLRSLCDQEAARGKNWAKMFWSSIKVR